MQNISTEISKGHYGQALKESNTCFAFDECIAHMSKAI